MNKRDAKIYALELAAGILYTTLATIDIEVEKWADQEKVAEALAQISETLQRRVKRLREGTWAK